jgi:hypothetical protein
VERFTMTTVRDIYVEVLSMMRQQLSLQEICRNVIEIWHAEHGGVVNERGSPRTAEFEFPTGEIVSFDGIDWHYNPR